MESDLSGTFINPAYATPEQIKQLREYAEKLQSGSLSPQSKSWASAIAQGLMGGLGQRNMDQANQQQRQILQQNANQLQGSPDPYTNAMVHGLNGGPPPMQQPMPPPAPMPPPQQQGAATPADVGGTPMPPGQNLTGPNTQISGIQYGPVTGNPSFSGSPNSGAGNAVSQALMGKPIQMAQNAPINSAAGILANTSLPPDVRAKLIEGMAPKGVTSPFGEPGMATVAGGVQGTQVRGPFQTGYTGNVSTNPEGGGSYSGPIASGAGGAGLSGVGNIMGNVAGMGRELGNLAAANSAERDTNKSAIVQAENSFNQYPILKRTLGQMMDDARTHANEISWGPQNETVQNAKKFAANFAPSLFSQDQINGIAAGDSLHKLSSMLGSMIAKQYSGAVGTDYGAQLTQGQVPGMNNSKEGFLALGNMIDQGLDYQKKLMDNWHALPNNKKLTTSFNQFQAEFYSKPENQIVNPITKNRIGQDKNDLTKANEQQQGGFKHLSNDELKKLLNLK